MEASLNGEAAKNKNDEYKVWNKIRPLFLVVVGKYI